MAFCAIIWKAIKFRRALSRLKQAKRNAYRESIGLAPIYPLYQRPIRWIGKKIKFLLLKTCCTCCKTPKGTKKTACNKLWINGTQQNEVLKGIVGLIAGVISTWILTNFLTSQLNFNPTIVTAISVVVGVFLTFGLTFSDTIRCIFILGIPQLFNKKGRAAILAYALVVTLSGPGKNIGTNMEILTESLICGQDMVTNSTSELVALAKEPFSVLKNAINVIIQAVKDGLERMNNELKVVLETIYEIVNVIKHAYTMLKSIVNLCNKKLGTPFDRCMVSFETASKDCGHKLGAAFSWMCTVVDVFQNFCYFAKVVDVLCWLPSLVKQAIFEPLKEHFKIFANGFKNFFDVRLNITYKFDHDLNQDKSLTDIARNMKNEIVGHVEWIFDYFDWMDLVVSFVMVLVVWKAFSYRYKFLNTEHFDNYYITKGMVRMDLERKRLGRDSVFPLRYRESSLYVQTFSWSMVEEERKEMRMSIFYVGLAGIHILSYVGMDFLLFQFLELIRKHGSIQIDTSEALGLTATIEGEGFLAAMYRSIIHGLTPVGGILPSFDTSKCLPIANIPNFHLYFLIVFLLFLCMIVAIMEPYGLRLRHVICGWVYPEMIIPRERWLYVHILSSRDSFLVFARRQIRAKVKGDKSVFKISFMDRLANTLPFCRRLFRTYKKKCFLCGRAGDQDDFENFVECPNCKTVYCKECFNDMKSICTACLNPIDYGDLTDVSEEKGSDSDSESEKSPSFLESCCTRICKRRSKIQKDRSIPSTPSSIPMHQSGMLSLVFGKLSSKITNKFSTAFSKAKSQVAATYKKSYDRQINKTKSDPIAYQALRNYDSSGSDSDFKNSRKVRHPVSINFVRKDVSKILGINKSSAKTKLSSNSHFDYQKKHPSKSKTVYMPIPQDGFSNSNDSMEENEYSFKKHEEPPIFNKSSRHDLKLFRSGNIPDPKTPNIKLSSRNLEARSNYSNLSTKSGTTENRRRYHQKDSNRSLSHFPKNNSDTSNEDRRSNLIRRRDYSNLESYSQDHFDSELSESSVQGSIPGTEDGEMSSSTVCLEEIDGHDLNGILNHKQFDQQSMTKLNTVLSEMSLTHSEMSDSDLHSSDRIKLIEDGYHLNNSVSESVPYSAEYIEKEQCSPDQDAHLQSSSWWNRNQKELEPFRKAPGTVSSKIRDRVSTYNEFYSKMPYPPHCNL